MKKNSLFEARRKSISNEIRGSISFSFEIVDRIHEILEAKGLRQKDLAQLLGKSEAEVSKWMRGTHNFTISTVKSIEAVLGEPVLSVCSAEPVKRQEVQFVFFPVPVEGIGMDISLKGGYSSKCDGEYQFTLNKF